MPSGKLHVFHDVDVRGSSSSHFLEHRATKCRGGRWNVVNWAWKRGLHISHNTLITHTTLFFGEFWGISQWIDGVLYFQTQINSRYSSWYSTWTVFELQFIPCRIHGSCFICFYVLKRSQGFWPGLVSVIFPRWSRLGLTFLIPPFRRSSTCSLAQPAMTPG